MSPEEILKLLGIDLDPEDIVELDDNLAAADEIHSRGEHGNSFSSTKLVLVGTGSTIYAQSLVGVGRIFHAKYSPGPSGSGPCTEKGTGAFASSQPVSGLSGNYELEVGSFTVKLLQGSQLIWSGTGMQKGLRGTWNIKL